MQARAAGDALVFDLMEPARPAVDDYLLDLLSEGTFQALDFFETRKGVCRILPPLPASSLAPRFGGQRPLEHVVRC